jgi:predicted amidohydrolase YtcJ
MKPRQYVLPVLVFCVSLLAFGQLPVPPVPAGRAAPSGQAWLDEFNSPTLDPRWSWVREDPSHWSLTTLPGYLRITTQTGGLIGPRNDQRNLLLAAAPAGDYQITTRVTIVPSENFQNAAIQIYEDDDNYVQLNRAFANGDTVNFDHEAGGVVTNTRQAEAATTLYLRIVKLGTIYSGYYSTDGEAWVTVGHYTADLASPRIGLGAANNLEGVAQIPADFDFFEVKSRDTHVFLPLVMHSYPSPPDIVCVNGVVLTMEEGLPQAEAIAVTGDRIVAVGSDAEILALQGPQTLVVDLGGRTLMPGFVDAHTHVFNDASYWELDLAGAQQLALENGITTLADMYVPPDFLEEMQNFAAGGNLIIRTSLYLIYNTPCGDVLGPWYLDHPATHGFGERLRIGGVKVFSDGGVCGMPAISFDYPEEYGGGQGDLWLSQLELTAVIAQAHAAGRQVVIHASGDRANETVQNAYESVLGAQPNTLRHRIEHNTLVRPDLLPRYSDTGVVAAFFGYTPTCVYLTGEGWPEILGPGRLSWLRPYRAILDANPGLHVTWHGDDPWVGPVSPILELYGLVTRKEVDADGTTICEPPEWLAATALTVEEALPMMTIEAAYAIFREQEVGSLKPGKFADVIILSANPLTVDPDAIKDIELWMTMVGGHVEYCAPGQEALCPGW